MRKEQKIKILAITVLLMYLVSGLLLLLLALLLYKFGLSGKAVMSGVIAIYLITGMAGGIFAGKNIREKKFLWGFAAGSFYFIGLFLISLLTGGGEQLDFIKSVTTLILCVCSSTAGGMIS